MPLHYFKIARRNLPIHEIDPLLRRKMLHRSPQSPFRIRPLPARKSLTNTHSIRVEKWSKNTHPENLVKFFGISQFSYKNEGRPVKGVGLLCTQFPHSILQGPRHFGALNVVLVKITHQL